MVLPIYWNHNDPYVCFVVRGESPGCRLFSTASMLECLRNPSPNTHMGAVRKGGAEIPGFVVRGESAGCRLINKASMFEWLRKFSSPTTHRGAVRKDGAEIPRGW